MTDALWLDAAVLAEWLKETAAMRQVRTAFDLAENGRPERLARVTAMFSPLRSHPLLLVTRLSEVGATEVLDGDGDLAWLQAATEAGHAFELVVELLRSRLPGYPQLSVPHLRPGSPLLSDRLLSRGFPWNPELRRIGLQLQNVPNLGAALGGNDRFPELIANLRASLREHPAWQRFAAAARDIDANDRRTLNTLGAEFAASVKDDIVATVADDFAYPDHAYRVAALAAVVAKTEGRVHAYLEAFETIDELLTMIASLMQTIVVSDGLLVVTPHRLDLGKPGDLRPVVLETRDDAPLHAPGQLLMVEGPAPELSGLVYPTSLSHRWKRREDGMETTMVVRGKLAIGSS